MKHPIGEIGRQIKKATEGKGISSIVQRPRLEVLTPEVLRDKQDKKFGEVINKQFTGSVSKVPQETIMALAHDRANGMTVNDIANKYAISTAYVAEALKYAFVNNEEARKILKGVLVDNAISAGMIVKEKMGELTPMQAAVVTGIMTQNYIKIDTHEKKGEEEKVLDIGSIGQINQQLKQLNDLVSDLDADSD